MKRRDIVIGLIILALVLGAIYWRRNQESANELVVPENNTSVEDQMEERFNRQLPDDAEKAELEDKTEDGSASGISTRKFENGSFTHNVLADLPEPEEGKVYQGWLVKGEEGSDDYKRVSTGRLLQAKGGWMMDFSSSTDYSDYDKVMVTEETTVDSNPEKVILEGSF